MSLAQPSQVFQMQAATSPILWVNMWCGLSNGSERPREPNPIGDLYSLLEFGWVKKTDTKLRFSEPHPAAHSGL